MSFRTLAFAPVVTLLAFLICGWSDAAAGSSNTCKPGAPCRQGEPEDEVTLLQGQAIPRQGVWKIQARTSGPASSAVKPGGHDEFWPLGSFRTSLMSTVTGAEGTPEETEAKQRQRVQMGILFVLLLACLLAVHRWLPGSNVIGAASLGILYICTSACMIETNKWLMLPGHFPYPLTLTTSHMLTSWVLASCLRVCCPSAFPALQKIEVTWWFCLKFVPIGAAFALSIVCGNGAYQYLSVSFLQIMKQCNVVVIYCFSVLCGLEALRRCSVTLLFGTLCGTMLAVHGELNFELVGFVLQVVSSLSEATKVIIQSLLMSGSYKLDPMTMVLFMAPACLLANLTPLLVMEAPRSAEIAESFTGVMPMLCVNAVLAFVLNLLVAQCIKQLSAVGYLMCGIVKDICIIVTSSWFLGESLSNQQIFGFTMALTGVASYSLYKQNPDCFQDDHLISGFTRVFERLFGPSSSSAGKSPQPIKADQEAVGAAK